MLIETNKKTVTPLPSQRNPFLTKSRVKDRLMTAQDTQSKQKCGCGNNCQSFMYDQKVYELENNLKGYKI